MAAPAGLSRKLFKMAAPRNCFRSASPLLSEACPRWRRPAEECFPSVTSAEEPAPPLPHVVAPGSHFRSGLTRAPPARGRDHWRQRPAQTSDPGPPMSGPPVCTAPLGAPLIPGTPYSVLVLQEGYSRALPDGRTEADGSVTLVRGPQLTLVDTGGPWGREQLLAQLAAQGVAPGAVTHVVCTHGHSDHAGNLNLFPQATLLVGFDLSRGRGLYLPHGLGAGAPYPIDPGRVEVVPTPGHTAAHTSVLVQGTALGSVLVAGDLFEREADEDVWRGLSEDPARQERSRRWALSVADVVIPGHGPPFRVLRGEPQAPEPN
ncbi:metallo-beta-lactamase domain-containing protein 1 [Carettochelys insculpta]|uniref:metallo-beta-lactamase domain-containing protein 1 n=1 Tax=Carettochelys insculpta TaxID=44489 RepID=UPI003EB9156A